MLPDCVIVFYSPVGNVPERANEVTCRERGRRGRLGHMQLSRRQP